MSGEPSGGSGLYDEGRMPRGHPAWGERAWLGRRGQVEATREEDEASSGDHGRAVGSSSSSPWEADRKGLKQSLRLRSDCFQGLARFKVHATILIAGRRFKADQPREAGTFPFPFRNEHRLTLEMRLRLRSCRGPGETQLLPESGGKRGWHAAYTVMATTQDNGQIKSKVILFTYFHITVTLRLKTISLTNKGRLDSHAIWSPLKTSQDFSIFPPSGTNTHPSPHARPAIGTGIPR